MFDSIEPAIATDLRYTKHLERFIRDGVYLTVIESMDNQSQPPVELPLSQQPVQTTRELRYDLGVFKQSEPPGLRSDKIKFVEWCKADHERRCEHDKKHGYETVTFEVWWLQQMWSCGISSQEWLERYAVPSRVAI